MSKILIVLVALSLVADACSSDAIASNEPSSATATFDVPTGEVVDFGPAPTVPEGDLSPETAAALETIFGNGVFPFPFSREQEEALGTLGQTDGDPRVAWILMDMFRFSRDGEQVDRLLDGASRLLGKRFILRSAGGDVINHLIAWDIPAPPGYLDVKRAIYSTVLPAWEPFFDPEGDVDWRYLSWGGVAIDSRPFDTTDDPCNCIPAADNPDVQSVSEATWLADDDVIFGVVINGEARAYPRQIMEVREMVNDTLGDRDFAMPYCTLCGSAQVWFTDDVPDGVDRPILRTSGLLSRSNKVMFDLNTFSVFDTFLGTALTGPLHDLGVQLDQHAVVTSTWADWIEAHPETTVLIEELALGRDPDFRNGRDADGPIFPVGDVDPRLPVQEDILGVVTDDGTPIAFHVESARTALDRGDVVEFDGVRLVLDGGLRALDADGNELGTHQAFWFAWSQFYENTELWPS
ncbi:MAG: hypothetical protein ACI81L_002972 [Verrucomicrobiales bacterium]|jgi:hypothetical protein